MFTLENKKTNGNGKNVMITDTGFGGSSDTSPHIIEGRQNARESNDFTIICRGTGGGSLLSK